MEERRGQQRGGGGGARVWAPRLCRHQRLQHAPVQAQALQVGGHRGLGGEEAAETSPAVPTARCQPGSKKQEAGRLPAAGAHL